MARVQAAIRLAGRWYSHYPTARVTTRSPQLPSLDRNYEVTYDSEDV
jgi:hypothetical protein